MTAPRKKPRATQGLDASNDVVVVGAGLIGLAIAFELAERGASVTVYDSREPGRAASWAAAGMLAPYTERITNEALLALCTRSLAEYETFVRRIFDASGIDAHLRLNGVLYAAFGGGELDALREHRSALQARGIDCEMLNRASALSAEPWLGATLVGGLLKKGEGCVDNRRLARALVAACQARGARIEHSSSIDVECDAGRVLGIRTDGGRVRARAVVNACGAWAAELAGIPQSCVPPIEPVKGQMIALAVPPGFAKHVTWVPKAYLVPIEEGRLLVGATVELAGFDERVTAEGVHGLLHAALAAAPSLADFSITESWAGLRPGTPDGLPFLGPTPIEGLFLATGHYRNGILLVPETARLIADAIGSGATAPLEPFSIARLSAKKTVS
ncbi:MAG: glycine oxidase ThiO [Candidatus Eremiobacteraeota bacterium]|nr:glycine oxidase ThiO [Candidatus Eremiobacteraeota bacterium]